MTFEQATFDGDPDPSGPAPSRRRYLAGAAGALALGLGGVWAVPRLLDDGEVLVSETVVGSATFQLSLPEDAAIVVAVETESPSAVFVALSDPTTNERVGAAEGTSGVRARFDVAREDVYDLVVLSPDQDAELSVEVRRPGQSLF
jgi:hypothetical protein